VTADTNRGDSSYTQPLGTQKREREKDQNLKRIKPVWKKVCKKFFYNEV